MQKNKLRKIFAWTGIILLVGMYLTGFIAALIDHPFASNILFLSIIATAVVPVLIHFTMVLLKLNKSPDTEINEDSTNI